MRVRPNTSETQAHRRRPRQPGPCHFLARAVQPRGFLGPMRPIAKDVFRSNCRVPLCYRSRRKHLLAHYNLGLLLRKLGRNTESEACFQTAVSIEPAHFKSMIMLGVIFAERGDLSAARRFLKMLLRSSPRISRDCITSASFVAGSEIPLQQTHFGAHLQTAARCGLEFR